MNWSVKSFGKNKELYCEDVATRNDFTETPTGRPKKIKHCYIQIDEMFKGAILTKQDIEGLMAWCEQQLANWENAPDFTKDKED